jgi:hypothetical protein
LAARSRALCALETIEKAMRSVFVCTSLLVGCATLVSAFASLTSVQLKQLQDPAGWDYIKMSSTGIRTDHPCFNGKPPTDECSDRLIFGTDNHFSQTVTINGRAVPRQGTYSLKGDQLTFVDELQTPDGPYTVEFDPKTHFLILSMTQVRIELTVHKETPSPKPNKTSSTLTDDQIKLLSNPAGWSYIKMTDDGQGTTQICYDGSPLCSGRLVLGTDGLFNQVLRIEAKGGQRHGTYTLDNDQLTLMDDQGTQDGPYTVEIDTEKKLLTIFTPQTRMELVLYKPGKRKESK